MSMYWIIFIGFALLSWLVSSRLKNKFEKYSKIPMPNGMTGKDVAEKMLRDNGIYDVKVISTPGHLTDHYNPANQTVNLSESVYYSNSIAAAAVAAHECGHAVQHATSYAPLKMRSALVPVVSFASNIMTWVLLGGMLLINQFPQLLLYGELGSFCIDFAKYMATGVVITTLLKDLEGHNALIYSGGFVLVSGFLFLGLLFIKLKED